MTHRKLLFSCRASLLAICLLAAIPAARAEFLQLPGTAFAERGTALVGDAGAGMLQNATGKYYAAVPFPASGRRVCRFSLIYRDNDVDHNVTARLLRKGINLGGSAFNGPAVMAAVASTGASDPMRRATTATIALPVINTGTAIYMVELEFPFTALEVVGVQIEHKPTCP